jgi:hypothetical protein
MPLRQLTREQSIAAMKLAITACSSIDPRRHLNDGGASPGGLIVN